MNLTATNTDQAIAWFRHHGADVHNLPHAETEAADAGVIYDWEPETAAPFATWTCTATLDNDVIGTISGIDFGRDGRPDHPTGRIVQAELAHAAGYGMAEPHNCEDCGKWFDLEDGGHHHYEAGIAMCPTCCGGSRRWYTFHTCGDCPTA